MDNLNWEEETRAVIKDISSCVCHAQLSSITTNQHFDRRVAYINVKTKEDGKLTVRLDVEGFSVVGKDFDTKILEDSSGNLLKYETIYALLNHLSPSYAQTFAQQLTDKLSALAQRENKSGG